LYINGVLKKSGLKIFIDNANEGEDICIFGDKDLSRDVVYVKDVAHAYYLAINSDKTYGLYNMTSGKGVTLQEQAEVIAELWAAKFLILL
jgi:UDP-glucose 4-epimerase